MLTAVLLATLTLGTDDLESLTLEELLDLEITSASRARVAVEDVPAAVHVLTREDIRRSGATSLPELLRLVPGVQVARINSSAWAVGIRGFAGRFSDKLLVMIDGRTVYNNLFSGVWWDVQDLVLEDIERIEVVRGPGGSVWGANAVNGVINVITRSAEDTRSPYASSLVGDEDQGILEARWGGDGPRGSSWRVWSKWAGRDTSEAPVDLGGGDFVDPWSYLRGGFRVDWRPAERDELTLEAEAYHGRVGELDPLVMGSPPFDATFQGFFDSDGGHLRTRWVRELSPESELRVQAVYDVLRRESSVTQDHRNTLDFDAQHRFWVGSRHEVVWGLGYRRIDSSFEGFAGIDTVPDARHDNAFFAFAQDSVALNPSWKIVAGTRFEHSDLGGFEVQPSLRTLWSAPGGRTSLWAAISRAVRTPSVINRDLVLPIQVIPGTPNTVVTLFGSEDFDSEKVLAVEAGGRWKASERLHLDAAVFYNHYDDLATLEPRTPFFDGVNNVAPLVYDNLAQADSYGLELSSVLDATQRWRLQGSVTVQELIISLDPGSMDADTITAETTQPRAYGNLRSQYRLTDDLDLDLTAYAVDAFRGVGSYVRLDGRVAWRPRDDLEISLVVQNAGDPEHPEFLSDLVSTASQIERSWYVRVDWRP